ncbi:MAG: hypothetical protein L6Q76_09970, partial [Polyangiaceae bacterium]|nr:hypothetical protein [Polyangiaceae bacterium]
MSHFEHLLQDLFGRHQHGLPVYTIKIKPQELSALRDSLWAAVSEHRMSVLLKRPLLVRCFVIYAAEFLVQKGQVLRWRPILESIGISGDEAARYPDLYDPIVDALRSFGRNVIKRHGARRFLATLLREGGLPIQIGNLPELIGKIAREIGWEALAGPEAMAARKFAVVRIQAAAQEPLRGVLEATEATEALEELLADAADARAALVHKGVDPTKLSTAADVRDALKAHGIALPGARDENLVSAILGSFREQPRAPSEEFAPPPRAFVEITAADTLNQRIELRLRLDLTTPALRARVPASVSHVAVSLEPGARDSRLLLWSNDTKRFEVDGQRSDCVEWRYSAEGSPITIAARYMDESGAAELLTLETIDPQ